MACSVGIVYSLRCLAGSETPPEVTQNPRPVMDFLQRRFRRLLRFELPVVLVVLVILRMFFLQTFRAETNNAAPEIPRGSWFLVWKPAHHFTSGDLITYRHNGLAYVGRVAGTTVETIMVSWNDKPETEVSRQDILGKVISVFWRASNDATADVSLRPSSGGPSNFSASDSKIEGHAMSLGTLLSYAYGLPKSYVHWSENRVLLPAGVNDAIFDLLIATTDHPQEALQAEIKKQLGLVAHREKRETNVLVLVVAKPDVIELAASAGGNGSDGHNGPGEWDFTNMPVDDLSDFLENTLGEPVINETELTQKFSGSLKWNPQSDPAANLKAIQAALGDQFGLELTPSHEPVEMLVVEKAN